MFEDEKTELRPFFTFDHYFIGSGRATVCMYVSGTDVKVGMALCSPKDHFSKKKGREIAQSRVLSDSKMNFTVEYDPEAVVGLKRQVEKAFMQILCRGWFTENKPVPNWAVRGAYRNLHPTISISNFDLLDG